MDVTLKVGSQTNDGYVAPKLGAYTDYRLYLKDFYEYKRALTKTSLRPYSYATFAASADIKSPNYLKLIIDGQRNLSREMAVKFARAMGAQVVAFTRSRAKADDALALGAHEAVVTTDEAAMQAMAYRCDLIIDTVSTEYPMDPIVTALKVDGTLCSLGIPDRFDVTPLLLTMGRRSIASSGVGGTRETREMLDFCAAHGIVADVEVIRPAQIAEAFARLERGDVRYRFVLDLREG